MSATFFLHPAKYQACGQVWIFIHFSYRTVFCDLSISHIIYCKWWAFGCLCVLLHTWKCTPALENTGPGSSEPKSWAIEACFPLQEVVTHIFSCILASTCFCQTFQFVPAGGYKMAISVVSFHVFLYPLCLSFIPCLLETFVSPLKIVFI